MSEHAHHDHTHSIGHYKKIGGILVVLAVISYLGPEVRDLLGPGGKELFNPTFWKLFVLFTAFGIAFIKAYLVVKNFMHLNVERAYIRYMMGGMLALMVLFFFFTGADVLQHSGRNWENVAAQQEVQRVMDNPPTGHHGDAEHGEGHGDHGEGDHGADGAGHDSADDHGGGH